MRKSLLIALEDDTTFGSSYNDTYQDDGQALIEENQAASEVDSLGENIGRSIEIAEALESLVEIIEDKEELTPTERGLIQVAGNMAVAGTDTDSNALVPSTESMSVSVAVETIKERLSQAVERIKTATSQMGEKISDFVGKAVFAFKSIKKKIADLKTRLEAAKSSGSVTEGDLEVDNRPIFHTGSSGQIAKSTADVKKMSDTVISTAVGFTSALEQNLKVLSKDVTVLQQAKDLIKVQETATKFFNDTLQMTQGLVKDAKLSHSETKSGADIYKSKQTLANAQLVVTMPSASTFNLTEYSDMKAASAKFSVDLLDDSDPTELNGGRTTQIKVRFADIEALLNGVEESLATASATFERLNAQTKNATALINKIFTVVIGGPLVVGAGYAGYMAGAHAENAGFFANHAKALADTNQYTASKAALDKALNSSITSTKYNMATGVAASLAKYSGSILGTILFSHRMALLNNSMVYRAADVARTLIETQVLDTISFINEVLRKSGKKAPAQTENQGTPQE